MIEDQQPQGLQTAAMDMNEFVFLSNRGSTIFKDALTPLSGRVYNAQDRHIDLLYFDEYGGKSAPAEVTVGFHLIDRQRTIPLDNKASMAAMLREAGINNPRVYFDVDEVPHEPHSLWFIKDPMQTAGKGIKVVRREQIGEMFQTGCIIQEAIQDLSLLQRRKFTLRAYLLVHDGSLFLFPAAIMVLHGAEYEAFSQDALVQFQHTGYMDKNSLIRMLSFDEFPDHAQVMANLATEMSLVFQVFSNFLKYEKPDRYCLFGIDALVKQDLTTVLIEINDRPNLVHTTMINDSVNAPMVRALFCTLDPSRLVLMDADAPRFNKIAAL